MNVDEFRRRLEVYLSEECPDLAADGERVAEALARRAWPLVVGWQRAARNEGQVLAWIAQRLLEDWPQVARRLAFEQSGSEEGWWPTVNRRRIAVNLDEVDESGTIDLGTAGPSTDLWDGMLVMLVDPETERRATVRSSEDARWVAVLDSGTNTASEGGPGQGRVDEP